MFKHFSEENKQTILNSNLEQLPLEVKETLIKQIAHEYAIANNIPLKINMYEELKFQEGYASKEGKTYTTNISKSYSEYDNLAELFIILCEEFHELTHNKQRHELEKENGDQEYQKYAIELSMEKVNREFYKENHDYLLMEIDANINGAKLAYDYLLKYVAEEKLIKMGIRAKKNSYIQDSNNKLINNKMKYKGLEFTGSYDENINSIFSIMVFESPVLEDIYNNNLDNNNQNK